MKKKEQEKLFKLLESWEKGLANGEDLCLDVNLLNGEQWIQLTIDLLNIFWPFGKNEAIDLVKKLEQFFPRVRLVDISEKRYATYQIELIPPEEIVRLIGWLIEDGYGIGEKYELNIALVPLEGS